MTASSKMMDAVEAVLSSNFSLTPKQVHERMGQWAIVSVRHALRQLVEEGRATFSGPDGERQYRRNAA